MFNSDMNATIRNRQNPMFILDLAVLRTVLDVAGSLAGDSEVLAGKLGIELLPRQSPWGKKEETSRI